MTIDFGKVERYFDRRGFGFVARTFAKMPPSEVFFHIKVVKKTNPELAYALDSATSDAIYFWYECRPSLKGQEVSAIVDPKRIRRELADQVAAYIDAIKASWMNAGKPLPDAIRKATYDLLTSDEANQLSTSRETLAAEQKRQQEEREKAKTARLQAIEEQRAAAQRADYARRKANEERRAAQEAMEDEEFRQLVAEMSAFGFTHSNQVSAYIVSHKLGHKYKHISGVLRMQLDGHVWDFDGGFPRNIYARLCEELGLRNQGSGAVPVAFTPYKDIFQD
jgi:hypothetical protein